MTHKIACGNGSCGCPPGGAVVQQADRPSRLALSSQRTVPLFASQLLGSVTAFRSK